jgi:hypothetical protein
MRRYASWPTASIVIPVTSRLTTPSARVSFNRLRRVECGEGCSLWRLSARRSRESPLRRRTATRSMASSLPAAAASEFDRIKLQARRLQAFAGRRLLGHGARRAISISQAAEQPSSGVGWRLSRLAARHEAASQEPASLEAARQGPAKRDGLGPMSGKRNQDGG